MSKKELDPETWDLTDRLEELLAGNPELELAVTRRAREEREAQLARLRLEMQLEAAVGGTENNHQLEQLKKRAKEQYLRWQWLKQHEDSFDLPACLPDGT